MAYYGNDGGESEPALVSAEVENEISTDEHAGEGCDALPVMAARITQTEVPSCVSDQQDANECGAPEVLHDDQHSADAHQDTMDQPDHLKATDAHPVDTDTEGVQPMHSFPGENEIGSMLADICAKIAYHSKWELREWVAGAKLLVIMRDVHGYTGERYEEYALARMPIRNPRDAHSLYLLGYCPNDDGIANGDLVVQRCEAESRLKSNYVWPNWRNVVADLRREAQRREQGHGAGSSTADEADGSEPGEPEPDEPAPDTTVDPVAKLDVEIGRLRSELAAARLSVTSERAHREEVQDALHRLRADITRLLSISEKPLWDAMIPPRPPPEKRTEEPEPVSETALDPEPLTPDPESPCTVEEAVRLIYRRPQTETCETVAEALHSVPMRDWDRDDFDRLKEALDGVADWYGDHNDTAWAVFSFESAPILFGTADGVLIYEDCLKILTWSQAMERIAPQTLARARRDTEFGKGGATQSDAVAQSPLSSAARTLAGKPVAAPPAIQQGRCGGRHWRDRLSCARRLLNSERARPVSLCFRCSINSSANYTCASGSRIICRGLRWLHQNYCRAKATCEINNGIGLIPRSCSPSGMLSFKQAPPELPGGV